MNHHRIFTNAFGALFPHASAAMVKKCWIEVKALPDAALEGLLAALLIGAETKAVAARATALAITTAIGRE